MDRIISITGKHLPRGQKRIQGRVINSFNYCYFPEIVLSGEKLLSASCSCKKFTPELLCRHCEALYDREINGAESTAEEKPMCSSIDESPDENWDERPPHVKISEESADPEEMRKEYDDAKKRAEELKPAIAITAIGREARAEIGEQYIQSMLTVWKTALMEIGLVSSACLEAAEKQLGEHYRAELTKLLNNEPNEMFTEPDLDQLRHSFDDQRKPIAGVYPGEPMTFEQADTYRVNPKYGTSPGYEINCQSCVVTFEARLRGYNVRVLPNTEGSALDKLSRNTSLAWIDPKTGEHPKYYFNREKTNAADYTAYLETLVRPGQRYTIEFGWKGYNSGHIINLDRTPEGFLRLKDNQRGPSQDSEWIGEDAITLYLKRVDFVRVYKDRTYWCGPEMIRTDCVDFDYDFVSQIMEDAKKD